MSEQCENPECGAHGELVRLRRQVEVYRQAEVPGEWLERFVAWATQEEAQLDFRGAAVPVRLRALLQEVERYRREEEEHSEFLVAAYANTSYPTAWKHGSTSTPPGREDEPLSVWDWRAPGTLWARLLRRLGR